MKKLVVVLGLLVAFSASAVEPPKAVVKLMKQWESLNDQCRGGSGDNPATMQACDQRDKVLGKIEAKGWCWGHEGQTGADETWESCPTAPSAKPDKPSSKQECGGGVPLCKDMSSCEEAEFYFNECGYKDLDRDNDGIPCESLCK